MPQIVIMTGRLTRDPEMRYTGDGTAVTSFTVAVDCGYGENKFPMWMRVSVWRKLATFMAEKVRKGSLVQVQGELQPDKATGNPRTYTASSGEKRSSFEMEGKKVDVLVWATDDRQQDEQAPNRPDDNMPADQIPF